MRIAVVGGGLAGCECAFALARFGLSVTLFEMKPERFSPAHKSRALAELVCSNSLRSDDPAAAIGLLKEEMTSLGSLVMAAARATSVPAGVALAVDRASRRKSSKIPTSPSNAGKSPRSMTRPWPVLRPWSSPPGRWPRKT